MGVCARTCRGLFGEVSENSGGQLMVMEDGQAD